MSEVVFALWCAFLDGVLDLERYAQGMVDERTARDTGKSVREACQRLGDSVPFCFL